MSHFLNYKLILKSGETFESSKGGFQGPTRDVFLEDYKTSEKHLTSDAQFDKYIEKLKAAREFKVNLYGEMPDDVDAPFDTSDPQCGPAITFDLNNISEKDSKTFLRLLDYAYRVDIDEEYERLCTESEAFRRAFIEEDFYCFDAKDPAIARKLAIRKRWFMEYLKGNIFLGFRKDNIASFDFNILVLTLHGWAA